MRDLVDRAMSGDRDAFAALAVRIGDDLYAVARRILRDHEVAQDAVQAALLQIWRGLPTLRDPNRFEAWSYRLLVNACYRHARGERRRADGLRLLPPPGSAPDPASHVADRDALERAFARLSPEHRAIVVLHHYRGLPLTDVAAILRVPTGTAYSRLHYAHRRLREALESQPPAALGGPA